MGVSQEGTRTPSPVVIFPKICNIVVLVVIKVLLGLLIGIRERCLSVANSWVVRTGATPSRRVRILPVGRRSAQKSRDVSGIQISLIFLAFVPRRVAQLR